ncbi:MAG: hypothetical protein EBZ48_02900 [Proteobacteria bacterium]|nr:hypothetical protein [Pseudomonadota bacterium]
MTLLGTNTTEARSEKARRREPTAADVLIPKLSDKALELHVEKLQASLAANPHQPIGILLRRVGIPLTPESLSEFARKTHAEFRASIRPESIDPSLPQHTRMQHALCDFILGVRRMEKAGHGIPGKNPGQAPLVLLECLALLSDPKTTKDEALSNAWRQVGKELDRIVIDNTRDQDGKSGYEDRLPLIRPDQPIETADHPLTAVQRLIGVDLMRAQEATSRICRILQIARGVVEAE